MAEPSDQKPTIAQTDTPNPKSPNPALMVGSIFAALAGMAVAVWSAKKNAGSGSKPKDPAP